MNIKEYLSYWDNVVSDWFCGRIDKEQRLFIDDISLKLNILHMPEPYWGDPEKSSIVIANYNPGGGADRNRQTFHDCANCPESFINQVRNHGYSNVVKPFPIIDKPTKTFDREHPCWWKEYGGRKWWLNKNDWIDYFLNSVLNYNNVNHLNPFAMEFCGWHSEAWPSNACKNLYDDRGGDIRTYIEQNFVLPLVDAIKKSEKPLGLCVGSQFHHLFETMEKKKGKTELSVKHLGEKELKEPTCKLHMYNINGAKVLVIWGERRNRYPSLKDKDLSAIKQFIKNP